SRSSTRPKRAGPVRVALFTNNYLPFCGGVTISVETLRTSLEAAGHEVWVFGPRFARGAEAAPRVVRYPSIPAATYPEFVLAVPYSRRVAGLLARGVRRPIAVVPTGVDLDRFRPADPRAARAGLRLPAGASLVLYVGRLDREKSVGRILVAFERVASTVSAAHLVLVGHGTEAERLKHLAGTLAARDRVHFLGVRDHAQLPQYYAAADVVLFASDTETQGLVLAEAAASGLPAVAVSAPGCDEVVRDGETGVLTKGDPMALGDAVIGLLLDPERRAALGARARQVAERRFDVRLM